MEIILVLIIIAIFVSIVTGQLGYILFGATTFLMLVCGLLILIFSVCTILLLGSKWKKAHFLRMDLPTERSKFKSAFYLVDGEEIPCLFPEEGIFEKLLYRTDKEYRVLYHPKLRRVFDRFSIATCMLGLLGGGLLEIVLITLYY